MQAGIEAVDEFGEPPVETDVAIARTTMTAAIIGRGGPFEGPSGLDQAFIGAPESMNAGIQQDLTPGKRPDGRAVNGACIEGGACGTVRLLRQNPLSLHFASAAAWIAAKRNGPLVTKRLRTSS